MKISYRPARIIEDIHPEPEPLLIPSSDIINPTADKTFVIRTHGALKERAYYLSTEYNWIVIKDDHDTPCLLCLRKD